MSLTLLDSDLSSGACAVDYVERARALAPMLSAAADEI